MLRRAERRNGAKDLHLLVAHRIDVHGGRRFHRQERDHLQQVVLHHVANGAGFFVKFAAALDAERLPPS